MATIYLTLSERSDINNLKEIRIRFKHGKIDQQAKTNIFIQLEYWDSENQQITIPNFRLMTDEKKKLKQYLTEQSEKLTTLTSVIQTTFNNADKKDIPTDWLKATIDKHNFPEKYIPIDDTPKAVTLFEFIDEFIENAPNRKHKKTGRSLVYNNIQQYNTTKCHLKAFAKSINKNDFEFSEINQEFYDDFVSFLKLDGVTQDIEGEEIEKKSFTINTVGKYIQVLKLMLKEAKIQGHNTNPYYESYHVFTEETDTVYLNEDELQQLKDKDFSNIPHLDRVRDWFLLLAWTGCRFSDLEKVTKTDIKDDFITFRQQKTNTKVVIPLHPIVKEILEKYEFNLPAPISNQKFNFFIKRACKIAEIDSKETITRTIGGQLVTETFEKWEQVMSHTGRRSFCTNMYMYVFKQKFTGVSLGFIDFFGKIIQII